MILSCAPPSPQTAKTSASSPARGTVELQGRVERARLDGDALLAQMRDEAVHVVHAQRHVV